MRRATRRVAAVNLAQSAVAHSPADVLQQPEIRRLTAEFLEIKRVSDEDAVDAVLHMGQRLAEGRAKVKGRWKAWLLELGTSKATACRYLALVKFAEVRPVEFEALRTLGASKMHRVVQLSRRGLRRLMSSDVAGLRRLSFRAFARLTAQYLRRHHRRPVYAGTLAGRIHGLAELLGDAAVLRLPGGARRRRLAVELALLERRAGALRRRL